MITLTAFMLNNLEKYHIPPTKKNLAKFRNFLTRKLKEKKLWDSAETTVIGRSQTKLFNKEDLKSLQIQNYLIKLMKENSGLSPEEFDKALRTKQIELAEQEDKMWEEIIWRESHPKEAEEKDRLKEQYPDLMPPATANQKKEGLKMLMLQAIFNHFYTMSPQQKELFFDDLSSNNWEVQDLNESNLALYTAAQERLKQPQKFYYNERK